MKIVWRMTGQGALRLLAVNPQGIHLTPTEGPSEHGGSTWNRPGDEWGSAFRFPVPGCWVVGARRDVGAGEVTLSVSPGP